MSTAFNPQTDGQAERANAIVAKYLRAFAAGKQMEWPRYLALAEYAYNASLHSSTGYTPFELDLGYNPSLPLHQLAKQNLPPIIHTSS